MLSAILKRSAGLLPVVVLSLACAGAGVLTENRETRPDTDLYVFLKQGIRLYSAGEYEQAIAAFDRMHAQVSPADSQLVHLCLYYGIRSRLRT